MYDLVLKGGKIYDGSKLPSFNGDVAISTLEPEYLDSVIMSATALSLFQQPAREIT